MLITFTAIANYIASTLSSYLSKKGLDKVLFLEPKFKDELVKTIQETLEAYAKQFPQIEANNKYPFYQSQLIVNELLNYRVMHGDDYNIDDLMFALKSESNIIQPNITDINNFYEIFIEKVSANKNLKKLEIKQTFDAEIFNITKKLDDLKRTIDNIILLLTPDLENQWKSRLEAYKLTIQNFKPKTALKLLESLLISFNEASKKPSNEFSSLIEYQKGICFSLLNDKENSSKAYIGAYRLNPLNVIFKEQAALAYLKLDENSKALKLADELISGDEFNAKAWSVKILNCSIEDFFILLNDVPNTVKKDISFLKVIFNNFLVKKQDDFLKKTYQANILPTSADYRNLPLTIDTYSEYVFWMNITASEYFSNLEISFTEVADANSQVLLVLNSLITNFFETIKNSEIDTDNENLLFLNSYLNFVGFKLSKYAIEMKEYFEKFRFRDSIYLLLSANCLQLSGLNDVAISLLEDNSSDLTEVLMLQAYCYAKNKNFDKYAEAIKNWSNSIKTITEDNFNNYLNTILQLNAFGKLASFSIDDFSKDKMFDSKEDKLLIESIVELLISGNTTQLIDNLKHLSNFYTQSSILGHIAITFQMLGENDLAIQLFRKFLDKKTQSKELFHYVYALNNTRENNSELLQILKHWRLNFDFNPTFLYTELQIRLQLLDWSTCIEICEYCLSIHPDDEYILVNYASSLYNESSSISTNKLLNISSKLRDIEYEYTMNISVVSDILIRRKQFGDGLELLYRYTKIKDNKELLGMNYISACVECSQGDVTSGLLQEFDEVEEGSFVKYKLDNKFFFIELNEENLKKEFYRNFLGAGKNGILLVKRRLTNQEDILSIERIMNKYLSLHDEILDEVTTNPYSDIPMTSFKFNEGEESLTAVLKSLFGVEGVVNKYELNEKINKYYNRTLSFSEIALNLYNNDFFGAYYNLINQNKGITSIPLVFSKTIIQQSPTYILDITSLAILFQMSKEHQILYNEKFIVSKYIVDMLLKLLEKQNLETKSEMSLSITTESVIPYFFTKKNHEDYKSYLDAFIMWIHSNCIIKVTERVLDFTRKMNLNVGEKPFLDYLLNTVLLVEDEDNSILITDDTFYSNSGFVPIQKIASSEFYAKSFLGNDHPALFEFVKNKYLGFSLNLNQLNTEYTKWIASKFNYYDTCLENINLRISPNSAVPAILHVKDISLNHIILPDQIRQHITAIFVSLLRGVSSNLRNHIEILVKLNCALLGQKLDMILESLNAAYLILDMP